MGVCAWAYTHGSICLIKLSKTEVVGECLFKLSAFSSFSFFFFYFITVFVLEVSDRRLSSTIA